jgi:hypothetical protein
MEIPSVIRMVQLRSTPVLPTANNLQDQPPPHDVEHDDSSSTKYNPAYFFFCFHFLKCVVGIQHFNRKMKKHQPLTMIATPSDEALALLLLENNNLKWRQEFDIRENNVLVGEDDGNAATLKIALNNLHSKYTSAGSNKQNIGCTTRRYQGWSRDGISRFNQLLQRVKADRNLHGQGFDAWFAEEVQRLQGNNSDNNDAGNNNAAFSAPNYTPAGNDLFDDDDGCNYNSGIGGHLDNDGNESVKFAKI